MTEGGPRASLFVAPGRRPRGVTACGLLANISRRRPVAPDTGRVIHKEGSPGPEGCPAPRQREDDYLGPPATTDGPLFLLRRLGWPDSIGSARFWVQRRLEDPMAK